MLTADLVQARRRDGRLHVAALRGRRLERALELADLVIAILDGQLGAPRSEVMAALRAVETVPSERRLARGLAKLALDRCTFDAEEGVEPQLLRAQVFKEATRRRLAQGPVDLDVDAVLSEIGAQHDLTAQQVHARLYGDLRETHLLQAFDAMSGPELVAGYDLAQAQAVLLKAVWLQVDVEARDPEALRTLFHRLKFHRLLFELSPLPPRHERRPVPRFRLRIDGPYSLFSAVSRYGLQLAMLLPVLGGCDRWWLEAEVAWGPKRDPLAFSLEGARRQRDGKRQVGGAAPQAPRLPDDVMRLVSDIESLDMGWRALPCAEILDLPGVGLCIPDLRLERDDGAVVHVEVMGYWSRAAVWRRVELVQAGLPTPIVFAVSERLRVSEAVLPADLPGALHVYKGVIHARSVLEKAAQVARRPKPLGPGGAKKRGVDGAKKAGLSGSKRSGR